MSWMAEKVLYAQRRKEVQHHKCCFVSVAHLWYRGLDALEEDRVRKAHDRSRSMGTMATAPGMEPRPGLRSQFS